MGTDPEGVGSVRRLPWSVICIKSFGFIPVLSGTLHNSDLGDIEWTLQTALAGPIAEEVAPSLLQGRQLCATWAEREQGHRI